MSWPQRLLAEVAELSLGKMLDQNKNRGELRPYLANINVRWGGFDFVNLREMRFEPNEFDRYGLRCGDIVMCEGGEPGRCAIWNDQISGMMIQKALHRIRPHSCINNSFLFYSLIKMAKNNEFSGLFTGSTIKHLPKEKLAQVKISLPSLPAQCRIAGILSSYDDLIENNQRRIALLEEAARLLYCEWFVHFRFPGHEHVKIIDGLPEGWASATLGDLLTLKRGYDLPEAQRVSGSIPIVSSSGITGYHNTKKADKPGIVTGRYGTLGEVYLIDEDFWPLNTALYVSDKKENPATYLFHLLKHVLANVQSEKAAVPGLNRNTLHVIRVVRPPRKLMTGFENAVGNNYEQINTLNAMNRKLAQARDLLLPRLMSGEISV